MCLICDKCVRPWYYFNKLTIPSINQQQGIGKTTLCYRDPTKK
jgi:hypothetical protein